MFSNCHYHFLILSINNKSMFYQSNIPMNSFFKMPRFPYISLLNLTWINRNTICNEQLLLDSSFQLQRFQNYQIGNTTTRSIQQIISSPDSLYTCNVSSSFFWSKTHFKPSESTKQKQENLFECQSRLNYKNNVNNLNSLYCLDLI